MKNFLAALIHVLKDIHMTNEETLAAVQAADDKVTAMGHTLTKVADETRTLIGKVADLTAALAAAGNPSTPEIDAALVALNDHLTTTGAAAQAIDDLVADAPVDTPAPAPDAQP